MKNLKIQILAIIAALITFLFQTTAHTSSPMDIDHSAHRGQLHGLIEIGEIDQRLVGEIEAQDINLELAPENVPALDLPPFTPIPVRRHRAIAPTYIDEPDNMRLDQEIAIPLCPVPLSREVAINPINDAMELEIEFPPYPPISLRRKTSVAEGKKG